jgi:hypothetical protein
MIVPAPRHVAAFFLILAAQFVLFEGGLRLFGGSEASTAFQDLFMQDPRTGYRPRPGARTHYRTAEFATDLAINNQGVRDDDDLGPKAPDERRVVVLGDSLVLSVQVPLSETFEEQLEGRLNAADPDHRWRLIIAGVLGYGPAQEWFFFDHVLAALEPDIVLISVFVGNDAIEAYDTAEWLAAGRPTASADEEALNRARRLVRSSMVLQLVRLRYDLLRSRLESPAPARALLSYMASPPAEVTEGLAIARDAFGRIAERARGVGASTAFVLMPARFQTDDGDYGRLAEVVRQSGGTLDRQAATERFTATLAPMGLPILDLLPVLARQPDRIGLFFQRNIHLTPRGHAVVGEALFDFLQTSGLAEAAR